jgi:hypothetical protein
MKKAYLFTFFACMALFGTAKTFEVLGTVSDEDGPISGADVSI